MLLEHYYIQAGFPSPAERSGGERLSLDALVVTRPEATFFMKMESDALYGEGIFEDDVLVVDRSVVPCVGALVVAHVDGGFVARRLRRRADTFTLIDGDRTIVCDESVIIWGVVTYTLHKC